MAYIEWLILMAYISVQLMVSNYVLQKLKNLPFRSIEYSELKDLENWQMHRDHSDLH